MRKRVLPPHGGKETAQEMGRHGAPSYWWTKMTRVPTGRVPRAVSELTRRDLTVSLKGVDRGVQMWERCLGCGYCCTFMILLLTHKVGKIS